MSGESMTSFIPIHLSALERSSTLLEWIKDWLDPLIIRLQPIDWFDVGHDFDGWVKSWNGFLGRNWMKEGHICGPLLPLPQILRSQN